MSSNEYNSYPYPYHQPGSAQQYSAYQTAPASNAHAQSSRQYQQAPPAASDQSADYLSYSAPSYSTPSVGYDATQDSTWGNRSDTTRDNGSRAAEVLRNMSNTGYAATLAATSRSGSTASNTATAPSMHYSTGRSPPAQAQSLHTSHITYGQTPARPRSVNTNQAQASASRVLSSPATTSSYPSQRTQSHYQQRTASPAQSQHSHSNGTASSKNAAMAAAGNAQQYNVYNRGKLPDVHTSRTSHSATTPYMPRPPAPIVQPPPSSIPEPYTGSSTTVDPTAVYDPWPEYQRQQATRDAARAEQEKREEEARKEKERIDEEERKKKKAEEEIRQAQIAASQSKPKSNATKAHEQQAPVPMAAESNSAESSEAPPGSQLESEIRAMMAKMRELNSKDPQLLARIWEEERRAKAPKSPNGTTRPAPQPADIPPAHVPTPPIANQKKKATPRESPSVPMADSTLPMQAPAAPTKAQVSAAAPVRTGGKTIWPSEKKLELARAAAHYLNSKNSEHPIEADQILQMLDGNPSYVELCEQLEHMDFRLDRAVFAKTLLLAVPDVNSASRKTSLQPVPPARTSKAPAPPAIMKHPAPPAVMKHPVATPGVATSSRETPAAGSHAYSSPYPSFPNNEVSTANSPLPIAEMVPIRPELKPPANKEEAARKRNLSDLIDLTQLDDEDDMGPPLKRPNVNSMYTYRSSNLRSDETMDMKAAPVKNFPTAAVPTPQLDESTIRVMPMPTSELRFRAVCEPLDKKKAIRRNTYNPATIARDVLLACGRHPFERQLNQHLDVLKVNLPTISNESDLSTIKWSLIDPGNPPPGYFKDGVQALTEDADDEDDSEDERQDGDARRRSSSHAVGGESARVQALPEATNPFIKQKRRGRPPRHSLPNTTTPATPNRQISFVDMSTSAPRPSAAAAGVGYSAFRSATQYGPDGKPLPKKKGRPVGWRKAIHGSLTAQSQPVGKRHPGTSEPQQPSGLHEVRTGGEEAILISSRSPSVANRTPQYQSFQCKWLNCKADLHNLETLKKHVFKVHRKETMQNTLECLWDGCGRHAASLDPTTKISSERHIPYAFGWDKLWHDHIQQSHFDPLAWAQGDGPAGGLSGTED